MNYVWKFPLLVLIEKTEELTLTCVQMRTKCPT